MVNPGTTKTSLKERCKVDLGYPYHLNDSPADHLAALQQAYQHGAGPKPEILEEKIAAMFGKPAAMWCATGTLAQGIAARIYAERSGKKQVIFHETSHLLLHEEDGYSAAHGLTAKTVGEWRKTMSPDLLDTDACCAFVEMPQRHSGGLLPSWDDLCALKAHASKLDLPLHMDGARIWSSRPHYDGRSYAEIVDGFSSIYVSFYKDIGAIVGAALIGEKDFIEEAKVWRTRLGGSLVDASYLIADTLRLLDKRLEQMPGFIQTAKEMASSIEHIENIEVSPNPPQVNMFHVLLPCNSSAAERARDIVAEKTGIWIANRFWNYEGDNQCAMEITVGEKAAALSRETFAEAVTMLAAEIPNPQ